MLNSHRGWKPAMFINERGNQQEVACFEKEGSTDAFYSCGINWQNRLYIFGGWFQRRQISLLSGRKLNRISSLTFDHASSGCSVMGDEIYLCFNAGSWSDSKVCRKTTGPLEAFSKVLSSNFDHFGIQISSSNSKFLL